MDVGYFKKFRGENIEMSYSLKELRKMAKELEIRGYSTCNKAELVQRLENHWTTKKLLKDVSKEQPVDQAEIKKEVQTAKPEDLENLTAEQLEEKFQKLNGFIEAKKAKAVPTPPSTRDDGSEVKVKRMRAPRKNSAWDAFLKDCLAKDGGSLRHHMKRKDDYEAFKSNWKPASSEEASE
jgi:hypothetical protein